MSENAVPALMGRQTVIEWCPYAAAHLGEHREGRVNGVQRLLVEQDLTCSRIRKILTLQVSRRGRGQRKEASRQRGQRTGCLRS